MDISKLLALMVEKGASDLFLTAGVPPSIKLNGKVVQAAPEFESCKKLATQKKLPLRQVYEAVSKTPLK